MRSAMRQYLDVGGQTRDVELRVGEVMGELFGSEDPSKK